MSLQDFFDNVELVKGFIADNSLLFISVLIVFFIAIPLLHFHAAKSIAVPIVIVPLTTWAGYTLIDIYRKYKNYCANKALIAQDGNLSKFPENSTVLVDKKLRKFEVFKKSNCNLNNYFWSVKTKLGKYFYTDQCDEEKTLNNILKTTLISEQRSRFVDNFFEYCLISKLANEDVKGMSQLSKGDSILITANTYLFTDDFFDLKNKNDNVTISTELDDSINDSAVVGDGKLTPDVMLKNGEKHIIIDAYNGSNTKEIKKKLNAYKNGFNKACDVYVVASMLSKMEQSVSKQRNQFKIYHLKNNDLEDVQSIEFGDFVFDIGNFSETYRTELEIFASEMYYWQLCEVQGEIIRNRKYTQSFTVSS